MRISFAQRLIFLANPRCASTSIRRALNPVSQVRGANSGTPLAHHACLKSIERFLEDGGHPPLDEFYVFTTTRNPWDRVVSIYHYGLSRPGSIWHAPAARAGSVAEFCFAPILDWVFSAEAGHPEGAFDIVSFTTDGSGQRRGDVFDIQRLEDVEEALLARGVEISLPHVNATERRDYRAYHTDRSAERVASLFAVDIADQGYRF